MEMLNKEEPKRVNMTSITACLMSNSFSQDWSIDSGATHHVTTHKQSLLKSYELNKSQKNQVHLPTGDRVDVDHIGEFTIFGDEVVKNVLHVPDFKFNMLSVSKMTKELSCFVSFYPDFCVFQDLFNGKVKGIGKEQVGLYMFKSGSTLNKIDKHKQHVMVAAGTSNQDTQLWHQRLGHPSHIFMKYLKLISSNKDDVVTSCPVCPLAKQTRQAFPSSNSRASASFDLVHMDL